MIKNCRIFTIAGVTLLVLIVVIISVAIFHTSPSPEKSIEYEDVEPYLNSTEVSQMINSMKPLWSADKKVGIDFIGYVTLIREGRKKYVKIVPTSVELNKENNSNFHKYNISMATDVGHIIFAKNLEVVDNFERYSILVNLNELDMLECTISDVEFTNKDAIYPCQNATLNIKFFEYNFGQSAFNILRLKSDNYLSTKRKGNLDSQYHF